MKVTLGVDSLNGVGGIEWRPLLGAARIRMGVGDVVLRDAIDECMKANEKVQPGAPGQRDTKSLVASSPCHELLMSCV